MFLFVAETVAHCALSLLVVDNNTTNKDSAQQAVQQTKDNNKKDGCQAALLRFSKAECIRLSMDIEILSVTVELNIVVWFFY